MAIDPSAEYPGQIITGLPGYPLGKAVNVAVSGDGTGTPLEAKWVSDLFGWEQALLGAAGITPSGDPDAVGASDYMDALDALYPAIGRMTTAESDINALEASRVTGPASATDEAFARFDLTTGKLLQDGVVKATNAGAVTGVTDLTLSGEALYATPKTRTKFIPCARAIGDGWSHGGPSPTATATANSAYATVPLSDIIPSGCTVTRIRVGVNVGTNNAGSNRVTVVLARTIPDTSTGGNTSGGAIGTPSDDGGGTGNKVITHTPTPYVVIDGEPLSIAIKASVSAGSINDILNWIEVQFTDIGPRNA